MICEFQLRMPLLPPLCFICLPNNLSQRYYGVANVDSPDVSLKNGTNLKVLKIILKDIKI